jgi:WD40 repeat protein
MTVAFSRISPRPFAAVIFWAGFGVCVFASVATAAPEDKTDIHGDSLPDGAFARLGTVHLRAMCSSIQFSADGASLVGIDAGRLVRVWDAADGKLKESRLLPGRPERNRWNIVSAFSKSAEAMLIADGSALEMWDIAAGKRLDVLLPGERDGIDRLALSGDGHLALIAQTNYALKKKTGPAGPFLIEQKQKLVLWDFATGRAQLLADNEGRLVGLAISPDGRHLASSSYGKGTRVWDASNGQVLWTEKYNAEMVVFTPDGAHLIGAPGGGQSEWRVWETATGKPVKNLQAPAAGYAWSFAVSPDGNSLLIPTVTDYVLWDLQTAKIRQRWPGANQAGKGVFAPDGRSVVTYDAILRRWDVTSGRLLYEDVSSQGHTASVEHLFFTPDGKRLASIGEDATVRVWDVPNSKPLYRGNLGPLKPTAWALAPGGSILCGVDDSFSVQRWSLDQLRPEKNLHLKEAQELDIRWHTFDVRFGADGQTLIVSAWPRVTDYSLNKYSFSFWKMQTGRLAQWGADLGREYRGDRATLAPDGRIAAMEGMLYDTRSSAFKLPLRLYEPTDKYDRPLFSPNGRFLARERNKGLRIWEVATGRPVVDLPEASGHLAAFSSDGRFLACATSRGFRVWDLRGGKAILEHAAPTNRNYYDSWTNAPLAFAPDDASLATGLTDGTILLWNLPPAAKSADRLNDEQLANLWEALGKEDPAKAWPAIWRFQDDAAATVKFLETKIPLADLLSENELRALLKGLDAASFKEREAASRALRKLGWLADGTLRAALKNSPSPEQKQRIEALLTAMLPPGWPQGENLRTIRAVAVLEGSRTPEARRLLETWAKRVPDAWIADEAARALGRLSAR